MSKGLSSLTTLALVQEGKIDLYEDVKFQLKSWQIPAHQWQDKAPVSPLLLMNHSSGTMHSFGISIPYGSMPSITEYLNSSPALNNKATIIDHEPGTTFLYSNPGFAILQQLIEDVTMKSFSQVVQEKVFSPLEMNYSTFQQPLPPDQLKYAATGHNGYRQFAFKQYFMPNAAAGGLWTTGNDFAKYVVELQKSYWGKSNQIISKELCVEMMSPHISEQYGLGLFLREIGQEKYFGHMGDNRGFFAGFLSHLTQGYAVIVLTNSNTSPELIREITKSVAKVYEWKNFLPQPIKTIDLTIEEKEKYLGRYQISSDEVIQIIMEDDDLYFDGFIKSRMFYTGDGVFKIQRREGEIKFFTEDGMVKRLSYQLADIIGRIPNTVSGNRLNDNEYTAMELLKMNELEQAKQAYLKIFENNPSDPDISENRLNRLGYDFIQKGEKTKALLLFELNVNFYPQSSNCYDSYAEALALTGEKEKALKNYHKALELNPGSQNAKTQIKILGEELKSRNQLN